MEITVRAWRMEQSLQLQWTWTLFWCWQRARGTWSRSRSSCARARVSTPSTFRNCKLASSHPGARRFMQAHILKFFLYGYFIGNILGR